MRDSTITLLLTLGRAVLPPWGDAAIGIIERIHDNWADVVKAARDGWSDADDEELVSAIEASLRELEGELPGHLPDDVHHVAVGAAVVVRWIALAPTRAAKRPLFPKMAARAALRRR